MPYLIQAPSILRFLTGKITHETRYFSPSLETVELLDEAPAGTICVSEDDRTHFEEGLPVRAIILLDPLAWMFTKDEAHHEFSRDQIGVGMVQKLPVTS